MSAPFSAAAPSAAIPAAVRMTVFQNRFAQTKTEQLVDLDGLCSSVRTTSAASKRELPLLKLATFGDLRTKKNSLRSDDNLLLIFGIEADYDAERISFADACLILREAGIAALIYTSPSHTAAAPRWRILCPLSRAMSPDQRDRFLARLAGLFSPGVIAPESWTLSQSYYYGSVDHNPEHQGEVIPGQPIDLMPELDATARGRPERPSDRVNERPASSGAAYVPPSDARLEGLRLSLLATLRREAVDGQKHFALIRIARTLGGIQAAAGFTDADAVQWLMDALPDSIEDWNDAEETAAWALAKGREKPLELEDRPNPKANGSHPPPPPPPDDAPPWHDDRGGEPQPPPWQNEPDGQPDTNADPPPEPKSPPGTPTDSPELRALLSIDAWAVRDIPEPDRLLGDLITRTTRMFLVGRTGLGKTLLGLAIAVGIACGLGFLHWLSSRPARVVYIDGEMPAELIKPRALDAMRRLGIPIPPENLLIFGRDIEDEARRICPSLPSFAPLNTDEGRLFIVALLEAIGGVDLIIFDNVMSLISGSMKDEEAWLATVPLVTMLTKRQIGQLWLDHTGHNTDRQYGTSTKAWQFDSVGVMAPLVDEKADPRVTAFTLSFDHPGKARRRTPDNWKQFQAQIIQLVDDRWTCEPVKAERPKETKLRPSRMVFYEALVAAITRDPFLTPGGIIPGATTMAAWEASCVQRGLIEETGKDPRMPLRRAQADLIAARLVAIEGSRVMDLKHPL